MPPSSSWHHTTCRVAPSQWLSQTMAAKGMLFLQQLPATDWTKQRYKGLPFLLSAASLDWACCALTCRLAGKHFSRLAHKLTALSAHSCSSRPFTGSLPNKYFTLLTTPASASRELKLWHLALSEIYVMKQQWQQQTQTEESMEMWFFIASPKTSQTGISSIFSFLQLYWDITDI